MELRSATKREQDKAYEKGKKRREENEKNPSNNKGPKDDGYEDMTPGQKEEYKKGYRGE
ncbi:MAG: Unknown protein [uncultured Sulfurovum sp.]|uniref:Uncharacterized protein n=1 Tax=uncultured Sulfurovum sp. TaxID=269237 RepID=A0A6S6U0M1_9BACT|nr:MAG: Unknown protein [uncultured Sulfurovum sp.]